MADRELTRAGRGLDRRLVLQLGATAVGVASLTTIGGGASAAGPWGGHENGRIPAAAMTALSWNGLLLETNAAGGMEGLNAEFVRAFGASMPMTGTYRTYELQRQIFLERYSTTRTGLDRKVWNGVEYWRYRSAMAAVPGQSNHGWAMAVDFRTGPGSIGVFGTDRHIWVRANCDRFGWFHPDWAHNGGGDDEAWHFEYAGGGGAVSPGPDPDPYHYHEEDDVAFTATGPDGQNWLISGAFRRPISATQRDQLTTIAAPATVPYLQGISSDMLAAYADIGGAYRPVTTPG